MNHNVAGSKATMRNHYLIDHVNGHIPNEYNGITNVLHVTGLNHCYQNEFISEIGNPANHITVLLMCFVTPFPKLSELSRSVAETYFYDWGQRRRWGGWKFQTRLLLPFNMANQSLEAQLSLHMLGTFQR